MLYMCLSNYYTDVLWLSIGSLQNNHIIITVLICIYMHKSILNKKPLCIYNFLDAVQISCIIVTYSLDYQNYMKTDHQYVSYFRRLPHTASQRVQFLLLCNNNQTCIIIEMLCSSEWREIFMKESVNNADKLTSVIFVQMFVSIGGLLIALSVWIEIPSDHGLLVEVDRWVYGSGFKLFQCIFGLILRTKWLEQAFQWREMYCHDLEVLNSKPARVELGVHSTSVLSRTWTKII